MVYIYIARTLSDNKTILMINLHARKTTNHTGTISIFWTNCIMTQLNYIVIMLGHWFIENFTIGKFVGSLKQSALEYFNQNPNTFTKFIQSNVQFSIDKLSNVLISTMVHFCWYNWNTMFVGSVFSRTLTPT